MAKESTSPPAAPPAIIMPAIGQGPSVGLGADAHEHLKAVEILAKSGFTLVIFAEPHDQGDICARVMKGSDAVAEGHGPTPGVALRRMGEELAPKFVGVLVHKPSRKKA